MGPSFEEFQVQLGRQKSLGVKMQAHMINGQIITKDAEGCGLWAGKLGKLPGIEGLDGIWTDSEVRGVPYWGAEQLGQD